MVMGLPRISAIAMTALLVSSSLFSLQLLLLPTPVSSQVQALLARAVIRATPIMKKVVKDYLVNKGTQGVADISQRSKSRNNGDDKDDQLGNAAAQGVGVVVFNLTVGTPAKQNIFGIMDITYQAIWTQCAPCTGGSCLTTLTFRPADSTSFDQVRCTSPTCFISQDCADSSSSCNYIQYYEAGDAANGVNYYSASGYLATDTFTFGDTSVPMVFGCSTDSTLDFSASGASGYIGFGRGGNSMVTQLQLSKFSYLLATADSDGSESVIRLGEDAVPQTKRSRSTPLLGSDMYPNLYYVRLTGIQVDGQALSGIQLPGELDLAPDGSGGVFLSTTMPLTYLDVAVYSVLRTALVNKIQKQGVSPVFNDDAFHLCYMSQSFTKVTVPKLTLVLDGGAAMELRTENYFFELASGRTCMTILPSKGVSVLGSLLQTGTNMIYDLQGETLTFEKAAVASAAASRVSSMIIAPLLVWLLLF